MNLDCRRLPPIQQTVSFLSPFLMQEHIRKGLCDSMQTPQGSYLFFNGLMSGVFRAYGIFLIDGENIGFHGFTFGYLENGVFVDHLCLNRNAPALDCLKLAIRTMTGEYAREGAEVKAIEGNIPDRNRAARWIAKKLGFKDLGIREDKKFYKGDYIYPCRQFLLERNELWAK